MVRAPTPRLSLVYFGVSRKRLERSCKCCSFNVQLKWGDVGSHKSTCLFDSYQNVKLSPIRSQMVKCKKIHKYWVSPSVLPRVNTIEWMRGDKICEASRKYWVSKSDLRMQWQCLSIGVKLTCVAFSEIKNPAWVLKLSFRPEKHTFRKRSAIYVYVHSKFDVSRSTYQAINVLNNKHVVVDGETSPYAMESRWSTTARDLCSGGMEMIVENSQGYNNLPPEDTMIPRRTIKVSLILRPRLSVHLKGRWSG